MITQEKCFITGKLTNRNELVRGTSLRKNLASFIKKDFPEFTENVWISQEALRNYRRKYLEDIVQSEIGELDKVEKEVLSAIEKQEIIAENIDVQDDEKLTMGQLLADHVARFGGSWMFIILFGIIIMVWIVVNSDYLINRGFDPYPYILLNLILSCLAALQAPVIMMSQNRKEVKDRKRSEHDYKVNLKAELEIRMLHEKIDHLMLFQTQSILELQEMQLDYLEELSRKNEVK